MILNKDLTTAKIKTNIIKPIQWAIKNRLAQSILFMVFSPVIYCSVYFYYIKAILANSGYNFEMAILSSTIGGFVLVGGFIEQANRPQRSELVGVGKWFLIAAVFSCIFSFALPLGEILDKQKDAFLFWLMTGVITFSMVFSIAAFSWAISSLLICMWKIGTRR